MKLVGPVTITAGAFTLQPESGDNTPYDRIVIENHSQFLLTINTPLSTRWLQPWTADIFDFSPTNRKTLCVAASVGSVNVGNDYVTTTYFEKQDQISTTYPTPLMSPGDIATAVATQAFAQLASTLLNTGSRIIDQPFVAARQAMTSGVELAAFLNTQASLFQSYVLKLNFSNGAQSATNFALIEIRFYDDANNVIWKDIVEVNAGNPDTYITDRMHGNFMKLFPTFPGGTLNVDWIMSNRPADRLKVLEAPTGADRILVQDQQTTVAAAATSGHVFVPLFHGPGHFFAWHSATDTTLIRLYWGSLSTNESERLNGPSGADIHQDILLPLRPLHYTINNQGAGSVTVHVTVTARDN